MKDIRLFRWLAFDEEEPSSIEISARLLSAPATEPGVMAQVSVRIRDLGHSPSAAGARDPDPAAQGIVLLAERFPHPPAVGRFHLTNEHPSRISVEVLYKNLFHGPLFQGVQPGGRTGEEGTEREVVALPSHGLLRSDPDPSFLIDPVLLDMSMHPLTGWHLEFPDQSGRVMLPIEVKKLEVFGRSPEVGARFISRASTVATNYRHFIHAVDMIGPDGNMWSRLHRVKFWRFYIPFNKVNFHGPKDEYFISEEIPLQPASVSAHCVRLDVPADQRQAGMRLVTAKVTLSPSEWPEFRALQGSEQEQTEWLFGRLAMKDTVRLLWHARHGVRLFPADIVIKASSDGRPVAVRRSRAGSGPFPTISFAHAKDAVAGLAAFAPHAGIDVAYVRPCDSSVEDFVFDDKECALLDRFGPNRAEWIARFWCAKKAVADALGYSSKDGASAAAICDVDERTGTVKVILGPTLAELFPHWRFASLVAYTVRDADLVIGVSFCEKAAE
jgi:phosphopantetheinyl transferase